MFDAYSLKKIAPRILIGIILINLSLYLVVAATEITRVTARGVGGIMTQPFVDADAYNFDLGDGFASADSSANQVISGGALALGGFFLIKEGRNTASGIRSVLDGGFRNVSGDNTGASTASRGSNRREAIHMFFFLIMLPAVLIMLAVMVTLIFRQGLLILLTMVAPVACALYILPSTDKYFKKWWELLSKTLLMYPIIMAIFALSDILASVIFRSAGESLPGLLAGLIAMFAPLALIPFSFKFAGGAMTAIYGAITTGRGKLGEMGPIKHQREKAKGNWQATKAQALNARYRQAKNANKLEEDRISMLQAKQAAGSITTNEQAELAQLTSRRARLQRARRRNIQSTIGIDVYQREAEQNKQAQELAGLIIGSGDDTRFRAATAMLVEEDAVDEDGKKIVDAAGNTVKTQVWRSLAGAKYSEDEVMAARRSIGDNQYLMQQALTHEINKAMKEGDHDSIMERLAAFQETTGMSDETMNSAMIGAGFTTKGKTLQMKRTTVTTDATGNKVVVFDAGGFVDETKHNRGTYALLAADIDDHAAMTMVAQQAVEIINSAVATPEEKSAAVKRLADIKDIAESMKSQIAQAGGNANTAYQLAMQQTGQEAQPGGSAVAVQNINDLISFVDHVDVATGPGGPTVSVNLTKKTAQRQTQIQAELAQVQTAIAAGNNSGVEEAQLHQRLADLNTQLANIATTAADEAAAVQAVIDKAVKKKVDRGLDSDYVDRDTGRVKSKIRL